MIEKVRRVRQVILVPGVLLVLGVLLVPQVLEVRVAAQSDLDAFMRDVMTRRDDNWRKLQQYILDEREALEVRGPGGLPLWGDRREYTWYMRDGFFIRSPLKVNGVTVSEGDRLEYEANFLRRERRREERDLARAKADPAATPDAAAPAPADLDAFITQSREPQFISSAYFLEFRFDEGQYAFVGREPIDGIETLRVEYYPTLLFQDQDGNADRPRRREETNETRAAQVNGLMNKGSRVTLWILPDSQQIVRYTFTNVDLDFFPGQWLVSVAGISATMTMGQPFPDVWLPDRVELDGDLMTALGPVDVRYTLQYLDYRQAEVTSTIRIPDPR